MSQIKEFAGTPQTLEASGASISNGQSGVANDADLDNTTALGFTWSFTLTASYGSNVTALQPIQLYLVPKLDGTNLADVVSGASPSFQPNHFRGTFVNASGSTTGPLILTVEGVPLDPAKYTAYLWNQSGQTLSSGWALVGYPTSAQN